MQPVYRNCFLVIGGDAAVGAAIFGEACVCPATTRRRLRNPGLFCVKIHKSKNWLLLAGKNRKNGAFFAVFWVWIQNMLDFSGMLRYNSKCEGICLCGGLFVLCAGIRRIHKGNVPGGSPRGTV